MYPWYIDTLTSNFWSITPENIFKWFNYEAEAGRYEGAVRVLKEQYIALAKKHNMELVRGHTLDWGVAYRECVANNAKDCFWPVAGLNCTRYQEVRGDCS